MFGIALAVVCIGILAAMSLFGVSWGRRREYPRHVHHCGCVTEEKDNGEIFLVEACKSAKANPNSSHLYWLAARIGKIVETND